MPDVIKVVTVNGVLMRLLAIERARKRFGEVRVLARTFTENRERLLAQRMSSKTYSWTRMPRCR